MGDAYTTCNSLATTQSQLHDPIQREGSFSSSLSGGVIVFRRRQRGAFESAAWFREYGLDTKPSARPRARVSAKRFDMSPILGPSIARTSTAGCDRSRRKPCRSPTGLRRLPSNTTVAQRKASTAPPAKTATTVLANAPVGSELAQSRNNSWTSSASHRPATGRWRHHRSRRRRRRVARHAVRSVELGNDRATLTLAKGLKVPVSRRYDWALPPLCPDHAPTVDRLCRTSGPARARAGWRRTGLPVVRESEFWRLPPP